MKSFPTFKNKNIALYYWLMIFMNGWFILPNWVFYFSQFIGLVQIGIIDGLSKVVAIVLEVPSGAISDFFGKKLTMILGNIFLALSCISLIYATNLNTLFIGNILMFIGFALISGTKEALLYDSLKEIKKENHYDNVLGKVGSIGIATTLFSIFMGGVLYRINPKLTFVAWLLFNIISIVLLTFMKEPSIDSEKSSYESYFMTLKSGVKSIFQKSFKPYLLAVLFWSMFIKSYEGVVRQSMGAYFGFTGETLGYVIAAAMIPALIAAFNYAKIKNALGKWLEPTLILSYLAAFTVALIANVYVGGAVFMLIYIAQEVAKPFVLGLVNKNIDSRHRATSLSTIALISEIPYIVIVILLGGLLEAANISKIYLLLIFSLIAYSIFESRLRRKSSDLLK